MQEIIDLIKTHVPNSEVSMTLNGAYMTLGVCSDYFEGIGRIQRQRLVKKILKPWIDSGELHAVCLKVMTPGEKDG